VATVEGGKIGNVLLIQRRGNATHGGVLAIALLIGCERSGNVLVGLAGNLGHLVDFREAVLVTRNAVAANAHGGLGFADLRVTLGMGRESQGDGRACDNGFQQGGQRFVHFASTIRRTFDKNQRAII